MSDPAQEVMPQYWVNAQLVRERHEERLVPSGPILSWRVTARSSDARTCIMAFLPRWATNNKCPHVCGGANDVGRNALLLGLFNTFAFDYVARCKQTGIDLNNFIIEQLPFPHPSAVVAPASWDASLALSGWIATRAAALSATTKEAADVLGYEAPVAWDEDLRERWLIELKRGGVPRCGYSRGEIQYVMDTFPIVARKDRRSERLADDDPNWRTKRLILEKYDERARHAREGTTYVSPDPPPALAEGLRPEARVSG